MSEPAALFAAFDVQEFLLSFIRVIAGVGGAIAGWFAAGPVTRVLYRLAFQKPAPNGLLPWAKFSGALLCGFLLFWFMHLGLGGGLGFGFGPGEGGQAGFGPGQGGQPGTGQAKNGKDGIPGAKDKGAGKDKDADSKLKNPVKIELISVHKYKQDRKYYLLKLEEPALTLDEVEEYFKKHPKQLEVIVVLTESSVGRGVALEALRELTRKHGNSWVEPPEKEMPKKK